MGSPAATRPNSPPDPLSSPSLFFRRTYGPWHVLRTLQANRSVIFQMARRDMIDRYRGSVFGFAWSLLNPLFMLAVYTFIFSVVFRSAWPGMSGGSAGFAVNIFAGMIIFTVFSESVGRAPTLVIANSNLVKKVVFPLEVLPWVTLASSMFHALVSFVVLLAFVLVVIGQFHLTALLVPLAIVPVALFSLGLTWFLASLGVFFRDVNHTVALLVMAIMFLSPIFYPVTAVPERLRGVFVLNPLARSIEDVRELVIQGTMPDLAGFAANCLVASVVAWLGLWWFMRTKHAFADVL